MQQPWPEVPALAALYDTECAGRRDLDFFLSQISTLEPAVVVDLGCGTGMLAVAVRALGCTVIGVEPAAAMLDIARRRPGGEVEWVHGGIDAVADASADVVVMTGHVAQYFVDDEDWADALRNVHRALTPGGHLLFETRNPRRDWVSRWRRDQTIATYQHPDGGTFTSWVEVARQSGTRTSYALTHIGHTILPGGEHLSVSETLRFRSLDDLRASLDAAHLDIVSSWGDWDGSPISPRSDEFVFLARRR